MIKLIKSTFYNEENVKKKLCEFITKAKKLSMGDNCKKFEKEFCKFQKRNYCVFFNSGSSANLALMQSMLNLGRIKKGSKVGFSALTWATNVMPLIQLGLNPIPIDVSISNLNVSSNNLKEIIKKTKIDCLFLTNLLGFCADIDKIKEICKKEKIIFLEDNCESLGSEIQSKKLGNFGEASTFSFFVGHHLSTIEGGMVCTDDIEVYDMLLMVRAHGWSRDIEEEKQDELRKKYNINHFYNKYTFYFNGYNLRPTEINGFLGIEQIKFINSIINKRNENFKKFHIESQKNPDLQKLDFSHMNKISNFNYPLIFKNKTLFEEYKEKFIKKGIEIRPIVGGSIVKQPFFKEYLKEKDENYECPNAKMIHELGFYSPNNPELTEKEIGIILEVIKNE